MRFFKGPVRRILEDLLAEIEYEIHDGVFIEIRIMFCCLTVSSLYLQVAQLLF